MGRVLVLDADEAARRQLQLHVSQQGREVAGADAVDVARRELGERDYDLVICNVALLDAALRELVWSRSRPPLLFVSAPACSASDRERGLAQVAADAFDCILLPSEPGALELALARAEKYERLRRAASVPPVAPRPREPGFGLGRMVGVSRAMQELYATIEKVAQHKANVLVSGESGTGKELVARAIHDLGPRTAAPFVAVNCGAIPPTLLESELFGHRRGAFTDAVRDKAGLFEQAHGGTLFLDEIGELPLALQVKILRALQEEEIRRVGDEDVIAVDVRVVAATLRDLGQDVRLGRFREDLFYRLNVLPIHLPPLRERPEDLRALVEHFVERYRIKHGTAVQAVSPPALRLIEQHTWPGNVRELENTIERAMVMCEGPLIEPSHLGDRLTGDADPIRASLATGELSIKKTTRIIEEELIRRALQSTGGNRTNAAKLLEISHRALLYKIKEYGV